MAIDTFIPTSLESSNSCTGSPLTKNPSIEGASTPKVFIFFSKTI